MAVVEGLQGSGIGRSLIEQAASLARNQGLAGLELETRVELVENHLAFATLGFIKVADHPTMAMSASPASGCAQPCPRCESVQACSRAIYSTKASGSDPTWRPDCRTPCLSGSARLFGYRGLHGLRLAKLRRHIRAEVARWLRPEERHSVARLSSTSASAPSLEFLQLNAGCRAATATGPGVVLRAPQREGHPNRASVLIGRALGGRDRTKPE